MHNLIGFCGKLNAGKTTCAKIMESRGYIRSRFATYLKEMGVIAGLSRAEIDGTLAEKNRPFLLTIPDVDTAEKMIAMLPPQLWSRVNVSSWLAIESLVAFLSSVNCKEITGRRFLQLLGTEWGRALHEDMWVFAWELAVVDMLRNGDKVVVDDVRFPNEAACAHRLGARSLIEVWCDDEEIDVGIVGHASEQGISGDVKLFNSKTGIEHLTTQLDAALWRLTM